MIWLIQGCAALLHGKPASTCSVQLLVADTQVVAARYDRPGTYYAFVGGHYVLLPEPQYWLLSIVLLSMIYSWHLRGL